MKVCRLVKDAFQPVSTCHSFLARTSPTDLDHARGIQAKPNFDDGRVSCVRAFDVEDVKDLICVCLPNPDHPLRNLARLVLSATERDKSDKEPREAPDSEDHQACKLCQH